MHILLLDAEFSDAIGFTNHFDNDHTLTMLFSMQMTKSMFMIIAKSLTMSLTGALATPLAMTLLPYKLGHCHMYY